MKKELILIVIMSVILSMDLVYAEDTSNFDRETAKIYLEKGIIARMGGDNQAAIAFFTKAIEADSAYAEAYESRGMSYGSGQINDYDKAIMDYSKAIELEPNNDEFYFGRALCYYYKKDYSKTWDDIHKAEQLGFNAPPGFLEELKRASGRDK